MCLGVAGELDHQSILGLLDASHQSSAPQLQFDLGGHRLEPSVDPIEPSVDLLESLVDLIEPSVDLLESLVDLLESLVDLLESLVDLLESLVDLLESLVDPMLELRQLVSQLVSCHRSQHIRFVRHHYTVHLIEGKKERPRRWHWPTLPRFRDGEASGDEGRRCFYRRVAAQDGLANVREQPSLPAQQEAYQPPLL
jgi:hypothetical protein